MLSKLLLLAVLCTLTLAQDGASDDGSGEGGVTGAEVMGQVLLSAKLMANGLEKLTTNFKERVCKEMEVQTKTINGNFEMVSDSERVNIEQARVSTSQMSLAMENTRKHFVEMAEDVSNRLRSIRMMAGKTLSPSSNLRVQQVGVRMTVQRMTQLMKSQVAMLSDAMIHQSEASSDLAESVDHVTKFTSVIKEMANKEGDRYKSMYQKWKKLWIEAIFNEKIMGYWNYVSSTLEALKKLAEKASEVSEQVNTQSTSLKQAHDIVVEAITLLESKYDSFKDSDEAATLIDIDDFNSKYSLYPLELLQHEAEKLAEM